MAESSVSLDTTSRNAVELIGICKTFPGGVHANKNITLRIREGEVHGLLGENGAGKTTLMNILYGLLTKDAGRIIIKGEEVELQSPQDAIVRGVGMVHQHFKLIPPLTVAENVVLGLEPILVSTKMESHLGGWSVKSVGVLSQILPVDLSAAEKRIVAIAEENGMNIDPKSKVMDLSVGQQQRVEVIKTLYRAADILILDEPTSVLTPQEVDELFVTLSKFKEQGKTIVLITHKLREPMILCDRISVLRDGELVGTVNREDTSPEQLARMMVGRSVSFTVEKPPKEPGSKVLSVTDLVVYNAQGLVAVKGVSFDVHEGEILGIAGVEGNGQTELVEGIVGLRKPKNGQVLVNGKDLTGKSPRKVRNAGVSHIPEDRHKKGLVLPFTIQENLVLGRHADVPFATGPRRMLLNLQESRRVSKDLVQTYSIKVSDVSSSAQTLSGGNQQKVVVARELAAQPKLLIAAQPTRGLDVGATEFIHQVLVGMRNAGLGVLLVSAELDEIVNLSDRIAVMFGGKIVAIRKPSDTTVEELGLLMAGHEVAGGSDER
ncbi:MAG: heme ABC transporter ATP-binding protein [Candidatus Thorarchaeota archaeon]|nr:MAG: heme ABC transporter ATP-binding protein [Candidatus Thorarchaeota archaeon]